MREPPRVRRGDPTRVEQYRGIWEALRSLGLQVVEPLRLIQSGSGAVLTADDLTATATWARITGTAQVGATYPWVQVFRQTDHSWKDGTLGSTVDGSGTITANPLYEVNGDMSLPAGTILEFWRDPPSPDYLCQCDVC